MTALTAASTTLRSEASALGSNLSIVQIRQDFSKNLINVLQTGASNLTLADTNEEAANSQALSDPPVDRGIGAGAGQPVPAERAAAAALILRYPKPDTEAEAAGETPPLFVSGMYAPREFSKVPPGTSSP